MDKIIDFKKYKDDSLFKHNAQIYLDGIDKGLKLRTRDEVELFIEGVRIGLELSSNKDYIK